jgi:hypothetical protein
MQSKNVLQLYDLMKFRLYCSPDRSGDNWNLSAALTLTSGDKSIREGSVEYIAIEGMRKLSQEVFSQFAKSFIAANRSLAVEIDKLTASDLAGEEGDSEEVDSNEVQQTKDQLLSFIIYQLANKSTRSGIGCGYYYIEGNSDSHGIREAMNDYLLNICFDSSDSEKSKLFIKYLFSQYESGYSKDEFFPRFGYVFEVPKFQNYWSANEVEFRSALKFLAEQDEKVANHNFTISIREQEGKLLSDITLFLDSPKISEDEQGKDLE